VICSIYFSMRTTSIIITDIIEFLKKFNIKSSSVIVPVAPHVNVKMKYITAKNYLSTW